jgi:HEAT repeat protein
MTLQILSCTIAVCGVLVSAQTAPPAANQAKPGGVEQAWSILDGGVTEKGFDKRSQAVSVLGLLVRDRKAVTMAEAALKDANADVRTAAAHALGEMQSKGSIPALKDALSDSDPGVVLAIAASLHEMNDPAAYDVYYEILTGERKSTSGIKGEIKVIHDPKKMAALGLDAGMGFIPFGGIGWGAYKFFAKDDISPIRASAAAVLSKDPDEQSGKALSDATDDKKWPVEVAALRALALRGGKKYLDAVADKMFSDHALVSYTAAAALIRLNAKPIVAPKRAPAKSAPKK